MMNTLRYTQLTQTLSLFWDVDAENASNLLLIRLFTFFLATHRRLGTDMLTGLRAIY